MGEIASYQRECAQSYRERLNGVAATDLILTSEQGNVSSMRVSHVGYGKGEFVTARAMVVWKWFVALVNAEDSMRGVVGGEKIERLYSSNDWEVYFFRDVDIEATAENWMQLPWSFKIRGSRFCGIAIVFGEQWVDLLANSKVTRTSEKDVVVRIKGTTSVHHKIKVRGAEWVTAFTAYLAELNRQRKFNKEKREFLRMHTGITLPMLLTAANTRDQQEWVTRSNITLIYDTVAEDFEPTDEAIITIIKQVGEDRNNRVLNLSGCQSQACLNALIEVLNARDDIEVLVIANCAMNLRTAQQLLGIVASNTQLRSIDISGNNLPAELEQTFHAITERNMWTMEGDGGLFALTQSHNESLWGAGVLAADEERYGFLEQQNHPAFRAELELPTQEQVRLVRQQPENTIPQAFLCSITHEVMQEPVMDREGHTFERSAIGSWLQGHDTCPISRHRLELADLIPNRALLDAIDEFLSSDSGWR